VRFRVSIDGQPPGPAHGVDVYESGPMTRQIARMKTIQDLNVSEAFHDVRAPCQTQYGANGESDARNAAACRVKES
jgi:hypothetical protein